MAKGAQIDTSIPFRAFPALKREMEQAAEEGRFAADVRGTVDRGKMDATDPRQLPGAASANAPAEREFQIILRAQDLRAAARSLVRQATRDETGQAVRGPKAAALDHLIRNASRDGGLSGKSIREMTGQRIDPRETPWCAAFVNAVLGASGGEGTGKLNARSFLGFGQFTDTPQKGDIAVFWRDDPDGRKGHVGFYAGEVTRDG